MTKKADKEKSKFWQALDKIVEDRNEVARRNNQPKSSANSQGFIIAKFLLNIIFPFLPLLALIPNIRDYLKISRQYPTTTNIKFSLRFPPLIAVRQGILQLIVITPVVVLGIAFLLGGVPLPALIALAAITYFIAYITRGLAAAWVTSAIINPYVIAAGRKSVSVKEAFWSYSLIGNSIKDYRQFKTNYDESSAKKKESLELTTISKKPFTTQDDKEIVSDSLHSEDLSSSAHKSSQSQEESVADSPSSSVLLSAEESLSSSAPASPKQKSSSSSTKVFLKQLGGASETTNPAYDVVDSSAKISVRRMLEATAAQLDQDEIRNYLKYNKQQLEITKGKLKNLYADIADGMEEALKKAPEAEPVFAQLLHKIEALYDRLEQVERIHTKLKEIEPDKDSRKQMLQKMNEQLNDIIKNDPDDANEKIAAKLNEFEEQLNVKIQAKASVAKEVPEIQPQQVMQSSFER